MESQHNSAKLRPAAKYSVFRAISDTLRAIKRNPAALLVSALVVLIMAIAGVALFFIGLTGFLQALGIAAVVQAGAATAALVLQLVFTLILTLWYVLAYALLLACTTYAVVDGAEGRKGTARATLAYGFRSIGRVAGANLLLYAAAMAPYFLSALFAIVFLEGEATSTALGLLIPVTFVWAVIIVLRFGLAPYVALFEPDVPLRKTLQRSYHLLVRGGQWFLVKGFLFYVLAILAILRLAELLGPTAQDASLVVSIFIILMLYSLLLAIELLTNGALVMLYRNRKAVKG